MVELVQRFGQQLGKVLEMKFINYSKQKNHEKDPDLCNHNIYSLLVYAIL